MPLPNDDRRTATSRLRWVATPEAVVIIVLGAAETVVILRAVLEYGLAPLVPVILWAVGLSALTVTLGVVSRLLRRHLRATGKL